MFLKNPEGQEATQFPFSSNVFPLQIQTELFNSKPVLQIWQAFMSAKQSAQLLKAQGKHLLVPELKKKPVKHVLQSVKEEQVTQGPTQFMHSLVELFS